MEGTALILVLLSQTGTQRDTCVPAELGTCLSLL